jgi:hypothetical protein
MEGVEAYLFCLEFATLQDRVPRRHLSRFRQVAASSLVDLVVEVDVMHHAMRSHTASCCLTGLVCYSCPILQEGDHERYVNGRLPYVQEDI